MKFEDLLSRMVIAYRKGILVPFTGAGLSVPACSGWVKFVESLEKQAGTVQSNSNGSTANNTSPSMLIRRVDLAVRHLCNQSYEYFVKACRKALNGSTPNEIPPQTRALASIYWPLILTTNYDDWYAAYAVAKPTKILGRSIQDCHELLASLNVSSPPILWALQGFLGGQSKEIPFGIPGGQEKLAELEKQLVIGHHQYQRVINMQNHFRRAFAEVFRSRSFLFVGSGLEEDYFINLFGEILLHYGIGSIPHFAFMVEKSLLDTDFLLSRLNINVITYKAHTELPLMLQRFSEEVKSPKIFQLSGARTETKFALSSQDSKESDWLIIKHQSIPYPIPNNSCVALSLGYRIKDDKKEVLLGSQATSFLQNFPEENCKKCEETAENIHVDLLKNYVYPLLEKEVLGVIARVDGQDKRDLRIIAKATEELLTMSRVNEKKSVHMGMLAAGKQAKWHPIFSLTQMIRGVRRFKKSNKNNSISVYIYLDKDSVLFPFYAEKLHIEELISCEEIRFYGVLLRKNGEQERILLIKKEDASIGEIAEIFGIPDQGWQVETIPAPSPSTTLQNIEDVKNISLENFGVIPGSTLLFVQKLN